MSARNTVFQFVWSLTKPRRAVSVPPEDDFQWMARQFMLANKFGGAQQVVIGDSNAASMQPFSRARHFAKITVNIGRPGSTFQQWEKFFVATPAGAAIRSRIGALPVVINLGGNNCWTAQTMHGWEAAAESVRKILPGSWIFNVPPVAPEFLSMINRDALANIDQINKGIARLWRDKVIDVHTLFKSLEWAGGFSILAADIHKGDPIHYTERADVKGRIPLINSIPWSAP